MLFSVIAFGGIMKAYAINYVRVPLILATLVASVAFVGCGRAKLKSLKKGSTEFVTERKSTDITADPVAERWQDRNDEASSRRNKLDSNDGANPIEGITQAEAQFASRIKNIDLRIDENGNKKLSIRIDKPNSLATNKLINEQELVLRQLNQYDKVSFAESTENTFIGEGNNIQIILTQENSDGLYVAQIKETSGVSVRALIRLNSTKIKVDANESKTTQDQSIRKLFEASDLKIQSRIVQIYSLASDDKTRLPLESAANKIKLNGASDSSNIKFIIKGYSSDSEKEPSPAKLVVTANDATRTEVNSFVSELGLLYGQSGRGKLILESYSHVEANRYAKIISTNEQNLRTIDADVLRMILKFVDQNGKSNRLVVDLQFKSLFEQQSEDAQEQIAQESQQEDDGLFANGSESDDKSTTQPSAETQSESQIAEDANQTDDAQSGGQQTATEPTQTQPTETSATSNPSTGPFYQVLGPEDADSESTNTNVLDSILGNLPFLNIFGEEEKSDQKQLGPVGTATQAATQTTAEFAQTAAAETTSEGDTETPYTDALVSLAKGAWNWTAGLFKEDSTAAVSTTPAAAQATAAQPAAASSKLTAE